jgi:hypothetical protein
MERSLSGFARFVGVLIVLLATLVTIRTPVHAAAAAVAEDLVTTMPANLTVPGTLRPLLEEVLRRSPTFRHQLLTLQHAPHVRMAISYGNVSTWHLLRAESTVSRYEWGALQVDTRLYTARDVVEVIAHEIEHVCEQIEGVDVRVLAQQRHSGVYAVGSHHFETRRAVLIGRQVAHEAMGLSAGAVLSHQTE